MTMSWTLNFCRMNRSFENKKGLEQKGLNGRVTMLYSRWRLVCLQHLAAASVSLTATTIVEYSQEDESKWQDQKEGDQYIVAG